MVKSIEGHRKKFSYVGTEELKDWNNLFNDQRNWGIRTDLEKFTIDGKKAGVRRESLRLLLLTGRAYEKTVARVRAFVAERGNTYEHQPNK